MYIYNCYLYIYIAKKIKIKYAFVTRENNNIT